MCHVFLAWFKSCNVISNTQYIFISNVLTHWDMRYVLYGIYVFMNFYLQIDATWVTQKILMQLKYLEPKTSHPHIYPYYYWIVQTSCPWRCLRYRAQCEMSLHIAVFLNQFLFSPDIRGLCSLQQLFTRLNGSPVAVCLLCVLVHAVEAQQWWKWRP